MTDVYKSGSFHADFDAESLEKLHHAWKWIEPEDLAPDGIEHDTHVTIRYEIIGGKFEDIYHDISNYYDALELEVIGIEVFDTPDGDCVHFRVKPTEELLNMRSDIERMMECEPNKHPTYIPHISIAFIKKGMGDYVKQHLEVEYTFPFKITADRVIYSKKDGKRSEIPLKTKAQLATESMMQLLEDFKVPHMAKIIVPKNAKLTDHAIKKHADLLSKNGGKYERHQDGRHIFRVPVIFAKQFYHKLWHTRGINKLKNDPEMSFY